MAVLSSLFLSLGLILAVILGPQTTSWSWGPSLVAIGLAVASSLPAIWKKRSAPDAALLVLGVVAIGWLAFRAATSPVAELAVSDMLLLSAVAGGFLVIRSIQDNAAAIGLFHWSSALLLLGNVVVVFIQVKNPDFTPVLASRPASYPSGFYSHYNEAANYLVGASLFLAGAAVFGRNSALKSTVWLLIAGAGLLSVYFTHSRGGILSAAAGGGVFFLLVLFAGAKSGKPWFKPLAIALPLAAVAIGFFLLQGWSAAQEARSQGTEVAEVLDNTIRLHLWGIAMSCVGLHPWAGGGSRSYAWESYRFWNFNDHGWQQFRPEFVHNELLQTVTDYGVIGGLLLSAILVAMTIGALLRIFLGSTIRQLPWKAGLIIGGLGGLAGMFVQSNFSFVFHLLPGSVLLGISLGFISSVPQAPREADRHTPAKAAAGILLIPVAAILSAFLLWFGTKSTRVLLEVRPAIYHSSSISTQDDLAECFRKAAVIWPQNELFRQRALILHRAIGSDLDEGNGSDPVEETIRTYRAALALNPNDPVSSVNLANILSHIRKDDEASAEYERAIRLQGGMEMSFKAHLKTANHYRLMGRSKLTAGDVNAAYQLLTRASAEYAEAVKNNPPLPGTTEGKNLRNMIYDGLGLACEALGDFEGALASYETLESSDGGVGNYRAANLLGRMADTAYSERKPSLAHALFLKARAKIEKAGQLPTDVTPETKAKQLAYYGEMIRFFEETRVIPRENGDE